ncbi:hypothetical protein [Paraburkholderia humisilvae]|uniref:Uncharacterized protein n=1 Tax=Paraburkholderia humisilvae TaxID=627669 RepID=A0A6J5F5C4_9BURK|nr:hypothetical protein [Paraburkholderia humisilvae]CAB3772961.1 hypothetical protein LMG29542_07051 [Paraburkholderia humisilvae]
MTHLASDPASDPPIPDQPAIPPDPGPGTPEDVPDVGIPEPEPDRAPPQTGGKRTVSGQKAGPQACGATRHKRSRRAAASCHVFP